MMSRRRSTLCLILVIYSVVYCETSTIFNLFKNKGSDSTTTHGHPGASKVRSANNSSTEVHKARSDGGGAKIRRSEAVEKLEETATSSSRRDSSSTGLITSARGGGWGWGGGGGHGHDSNLDLYSLLGGLSFASLLGATIVYLARRSSTTVVMNNSSGRRRRRDLDNLDEEIDGMSLPEFLDKLGLSLFRPWWDKRRGEGTRSPITLQY